MTKARWHDEGKATREKDGDKWSIKNAAYRQWCTPNGQQTGSSLAAAQYLQHTQGPAMPYTGNKHLTKYMYINNAVVLYLGGVYYTCWGRATFANA